MHNLLLLSSREFDKKMNNTLMSITTCYMYIVSICVVSTLSATELELLESNSLYALLKKEEKKSSLINMLFLICLIHKQIEM